MTRVNPYLKQKILFVLSTYIYSAAYEKQSKRLEEIITKNSSITGYGDLVMSYKGKQYSCHKGLRTERIVNRLHSALRPYMDEWLIDDQKIVEEHALVNTCLASILNASNNVSDYFRLLPDCVHSALQPYAQHSDVQPPLSDEQISAIQAKNQKTVSLIKQRLLLNLIV